MAVAIVGREAVTGFTTSPPVAPANAYAQGGVF